MTDVKICGLSTPDTLAAAAAAGARHAGFVFYPSSPRAVTPDIASALAARAPGGLGLVGVFVDPNDDDLRRACASVPFAMIQLHGREDPRRVAAVRALCRLPVMKAIPVAAPADLEAVPAFEAVADWLLFDAKTSGALPGGAGVSFDWQILRGFKHVKPWMLSGGLTTENVGRALGLLTPDAVDVSSGVEDAPGVKSAQKIRDFIKTVAP